MRDTDTPPAAEHLQQKLGAGLILGALGVVPDFRILDLADDFLQARLLAVEVKDTSAALRLGWRALRAGCRSH